MNRAERAACLVAFCAATGMLAALAVAVVQVKDSEGAKFEYWHGFVFFAVLVSGVITWITAAAISAFALIAASSPTPAEEK